MHCRRCKKKVSHYAKMCPYCHARIQKNDRATRQYMEMLTENKVTHKNEGSKFGKKMGFTLFSAFFAIYLLLISYKDRMNQWQVTDQTVFYMKEDGLIAKNLKTGENRKVLELSQEKMERAASAAVEGQVFYRDEGREKLYYAKDIVVRKDSNDYSIVERDTKDWSKANKTLADHVRIHLWDNSGTLYFAKRDSKFLYCFDKGETIEIEIPLVKEIHQVEGTDKLFVIAFEPRHDAKSYDYSSYEKTESVVFYLLDGKTKKAEKLFHNRVEGYAYTSDCRHFYYQVENQLFDFDLVEKKSNVFEKNVYEFLVAHTGGKDKLYYISYNLKSSSLYEYVDDPFKEADAKAQNKKKDSKGKDEEEENRASRDAFRKQLKDEKLYIFDGALYLYEDGKKQMVSEGINMLDSLYCCMVDHEPSVYKSKSIKLGKYQLKKEGQEDVNSVYDMVVNMVDGENKNYDLGCETLFEYRKDKNIKEKREVLMYIGSVQYKVDNGKLIKNNQDSSEDEDMKGSYLNLEGKKYYISWHDDYTLYEEADGKKVEVIPYVESYQVLKDGRILALCYDEKKGKEILYCIDTNLNKQEVDSQVYAILGKNAVSSKRW